jgi:hypothetical protein
MLKTKRRGLEVLKSKEDCEKFFKNATSVKTVELQCEGVLRRNNLPVSIIDWATATEQAMETGNEIAVHFVRAASARCDVLDPKLVFNISGI